MSVFDSGKINNPITPKYVLDKGFTWNRGVVPPEECGGQPFGSRLIKYDYDLNTIIKYLLLSTQLVVSLVIHNHTNILLMELITAHHIMLLKRMKMIM